MFRVRSKWLALLVGCLATLRPLPARAHGAAEGRDVLLPEDDPARLLLAATNGLFWRTSSESWGWQCAGAILSPLSDPDSTVSELASASGALFANAGTAVLTSADGGCGWERKELEGRIISLAAYPGDADRVLALTQERAPLWVGDTNGWKQHTTTFAKSFVPRLGSFSAAAWYVVGHQLEEESMEIRFQLQKSEDDGESWQAIDIDFLPEFLAASPTDPDVMFAATRADVSRVVVTEDGGQSWRELFSSPERIGALGASPDGRRVAVGVAQPVGDETSAANHPSSSYGLWLVDRESAARRVLTTPVACIRWWPNLLAACTQSLSSPLDVAISADEGQSFDLIFSPASIEPRTECDSVASACRDYDPPEFEESPKETAPAATPAPPRDDGCNVSERSTLPPSPLAVWSILALGTYSTVRRRIARGYGHRRFKGRT